MLALLTARNRPQTLLLAALFLLITAAATMLACGPVAQPAPADGNAVPPAQQEGGDNAEESGDADPPPPPTVPTPSYPKIKYGLQYEVVEFEEAQDAASGPSGQSDSAPEDTAVFVRILLSGNKAEVAAWLRSKGITPAHADDPSISNLNARVPLSLLGELSQQDGVTRIERPLQPEPANLGLEP